MDNYHKHNRCQCKLLNFMNGHQILFQCLFRRRLESSLNQTESELKRLKQDLQNSRHNEQDIRSQLQTVSSNERSLKSEVHQLKNDNEIYQQK